MKKFEYNENEHDLLMTDEIHEPEQYGYCSEENCGKRPKYHDKIKVNGMFINVQLCDDHVDKWNKHVHNKYIVIQ